MAFPLISFLQSRQSREVVPIDSAVTAATAGQNFDCSFAWLDH